MNWNEIIATTIAVALGVIIAALIQSRIPMLNTWDSTPNDMDDPFYD